MGYILNYKKWRAVHEAAIFEGKNDPMLPKQELTIANKLDLRDIIFDGGFARGFIAANDKNQNIVKIANSLKSISNQNGGHSGLLGGSTVTEYGGNLEAGSIEKVGATLLTTLLTAATGQFTEKEFEMLDPNSISFTDAGYTVKFTPDEGYVASKGDWYFGGSVISARNVGDDAFMSYEHAIRAMNSYNIKSKAFGSSTGQYNGKEDNFTDGFFDISLTPGAGGVDDPVIFFIPQLTSGSTTTRTETDVTKVTAGVSADKTQADVGFEVGSSILTAAGKTQVAELAKTILEKFKGQTVTGFNLISSASPEYGAIKNVTGWEKSYDVTTGTTDPGVGTTDSAKNKKLAYDRGVSFMTELNTQLAGQGHAGFQDYTITWKIASTGGPNNNGRFVDLNLATNEQKPKIEKVGTKVGSTATAGSTRGG